MSRKIFLVGPSGAGKDTVANILIRLLNDEELFVDMVRLSTPVREFKNLLVHCVSPNVRFIENNVVNEQYKAIERLALLMGLNRDFIISLLRKYNIHYDNPDYIESRSFLQDIGGLMRYYGGENILCKGVINKIREYDMGWVIVPDVRTQTEIYSLKQEFGDACLFLYIDTKLRVRLQRVLNRDESENVDYLKGALESQSELLKPICDGIIINNGTKEELQETLIDLLFKDNSILNK